MQDKDIIWSDTLSRDLYREFAGRGVIITGVGDENIGAALADAFHWLGAKVAMLGRNEAALGAFCEKLEKRKDENFQLYPAFRYTGDLSVERGWRGALEAAYAAVGAPYVFINCMANDRRVDLADIGQAELETLHRINFIAPILMARDVIKKMRGAEDGDGGSVCLFSSHHGAGLNDTMLLGYGPAKAALDKGIRLLADWSAKDQTGMNIIRVNGERPGWVATPAQLERFSKDVIEDATRKQRIPGVMGPLDIVPQIVSHIARMTGGWSSGTVYETDAGRADESFRRGSI